MEGLQSLHRRVVSIDVHRMLHVVTVVIGHSDGSSIQQFNCEFGAIKVCGVGSDINGVSAHSER